MTQEDVKKAWENVVEPIEKAKLALGKYITENPDKVKKDLEEMRKRSKKYKNGCDMTQTYIEIKKAWKEGAEIEWYSPRDNKWITTNDPAWLDNLTYRIKQTEEQNQYDFINPTHYKKSSKEVYEMMVDIWGVEAFIAHCEMTAFKYRMRAGTKPDQPIERDLMKAKWYEDKAEEFKQQLKNDNND